MIYLDNNATTKVDERVLDAMLPYFKEEYANPSSMYDFAKPASRALKEARGVLKDFVGANDEKEMIWGLLRSKGNTPAAYGTLQTLCSSPALISSLSEAMFAQDA